MKVKKRPKGSDFGLTSLDASMLDARVLMYQGELEFYCDTLEKALDFACSELEEYTEMKCEHHCGGGCYNIDKEECDEDCFFKHAQTKEQWKEMCLNDG